MSMSNDDMKKLIFTDQMFAFVEQEWEKFRKETNITDDFYVQMIAEYIGSGGKTGPDIMKLFHMIFAGGVTVGCMKGADMALDQVDKHVKGMFK